MLVVYRDIVPHTGAPLPPLQTVERPADSALEGGANIDRLESRQMKTSTDI